MKILYVEDNAVNLSLVQRIARMNNHQLVSHSTAEDALSSLKDDDSIDLILLDIQLAGEMDGIGFAKKMRADGRQEPIIAITAYAMMGDRERILEAGCNEYLPKPLPIAEFLTLLAKYDPSLRKEAAPTAEGTVVTKPPPPSTGPLKPSSQPAQATPTKASPTASPTAIPQAKAKKPTIKQTPKRAKDSSALKAETPQSPTDKAKPVKGDASPTHHPAPDSDADNRKGDNLGKNHDNKD